MNDVRPYLSDELKRRGFLDCFGRGSLAALATASGYAPATVRNARARGHLPERMVTRFATTLGTDIHEARTLLRLPWTAAREDGR